MKKQISAFIFAGILSSVWLFQFLSDRQLLFLIVGYNIVYILIRLINKPYILLIIGAITAAISYVSLEYLTVFLPSTLFMVLLQYVSHDHPPRPLKKDHYFCFSLIVFSGSTVASVVLLLLYDHTLVFAETVRDRHFLVLVLCAGLFVYLTLHINRKNASVKKALNQSRILKKRKLVLIFTIQIIACFSIMFAAVKYYLPAVVCSYVPLLCIYSMITDEKVLQVLFRDS